MAEVGSCRLLASPCRSVRPCRNRFSKHQFTQPELLDVLCLVFYEDWPFAKPKHGSASIANLRQTLGCSSELDLTTRYHFLERGRCQHRPRRGRGGAPLARHGQKRRAGCGIFS